MTPYYSQDGITIYHGDCREVLPSLDLSAVNLAVIDPPYGIGHSSNFGATWNGEQIANDHSTDLRNWLVGYLSPLPMYVFGTWKVVKPKGIRSTLIWDKGPASGMGDLSFPWKGSFEEIYVIGEGFAGRRDEGVIRGHTIVTWESKGRGHQHAKPESLVKYLASKVPAADFIIDPTMGSGTTLRAAKDLGMRAIGIDVDEECCETTANRLAQGVLFPASVPA
jgi:DNA modification methylase